MITGLTIKEAIAEGYKYCNVEESEDHVIKIADIQSGKIPWDFRETTYFVCEKEARHHRVDDESISNIIQDLIDGQEEYYMEDGFDDALDGCDELIDALTITINQNLRKHNFYFTTDIKLLP